MKFQPKRFVVEVKRGTSRASFASPDATADRFSDAEAALFGAAGKADAKPSPASAAKAEVPSGRILRSLVEPPPPVVEDAPPPIRRGRKPGSKNKPKPQLEGAAAAVVDKPRRGRKPGSKNKPKPQATAAFPPADTAGQQSLAAAMRSYGFVDDGTTWTVADAAPDPTPTTPMPAPAEAVAAGGTGQVEPAASKPSRSRLRLRDRSSILKRYVLDIDPRPGQPGAIRARRMARSL